MRNCKDFICKTCSAVAEAGDPFPTCITIDGDEFEIVSKCCYLGDVIGQAGGCLDAVIAHIRSAWKPFNELLPILTNRDISLLNRGKVLKAYARSVLLYGGETWLM